MEPSVELGKCIELMAHPDNLMTTVGTTGAFITFFVFSMIKKSMPSLLKDALKALVNFLGKKK